jgi:hypothetical protein
MDRGRMREQREGQSRPGLAERERTEEAINVARERNAQRVQKHRAKLKEIAEYVDEDCEDSDEFEEGFSRYSLHYHVQKLVTAVQPVLARCPGIRSRQKVIEKFLGHPCIKLSLPSYYLSPKEAAAQQLLIEGLRLDLAGVKGIHSQEKLAWKGILMSAAVRKSVEDFAEGQGRAIARVLNTNPMNVYDAMKRRRLGAEGSSSQWSLLSSKKWADGVDEATKDLVTQWWHQKTRVSPIQKQVVNRRIGPN